MTNKKEGKKMNKEEKLAKAIAFAAEKHANQKRKDGTPYIFHPLTVAELLKRYVTISITRWPESFTMCWKTLMRRMRK